MTVTWLSHALSHALSHDYHMTITCTITWLSHAHGFTSTHHLNNWWLVLTENFIWLLEQITSAAELELLWKLEGGGRREEGGGRREEGGGRREEGGGRRGRRRRRKGGWLSTWSHCVILWYINLSLSPPVSDEWWSLTLGVLEILSSLDWSCHIARNESLKGEYRDQKMSSVPAYLMLEDITMLSTFTLRSCDLYT